MYMKHNYKNLGFLKKYLVFSICKLSWHVILTEEVNNQTVNNNNDDDDRNN